MIEKAKEILKAVEKGIENDEHFVVDAEELRDVLTSFLNTHEAAKYPNLRDITRDWVNGVREYYKNTGNLTQVFMRGYFAGMSEREVKAFADMLFVNDERTPPKMDGYPCMWFFQSYLQWSIWASIIAFQFVGANIFFYVDRWIFKK
jgi:hypothetical protein